VTAALTHCHYCNTPISASLIEEKTQGKEDVLCEGCGIELENETIQISTPDITTIPPQERIKKDPQKVLEFRKLSQKIKDFIFRYVYEIIKNLAYSKELRNGDQYLTDAQVRSLAYKLRKKLIKHRFPQRWLDSTGVKAKYIDEFYTHTLKILKKKKFYRLKYRESFQKYFRIVFQFITGALKSAEFPRKQERQIINALKRTYCFYYNGIDRDTFEYFITRLSTRFIYKLVKQHRPFFEENRNQANIIREFVYKIANALTLYISKWDLPAQWLEDTELTREGRKKFDRKYRILQENICTDKLYHESVMDHMTHLIRLTLSRQLGIILQLNNNLRTVFSLRKITSRLNSAPKKIIQDITLASKDNKPTTVKSTLDTGSDVCLIDAALVSQLKLPTDSKNHITIKDLNKTKVTADKCSTYTIFEDSKGQCDFYVFEGLNDIVGTPILIGMDLINGIIDEKGSYIIGSRKSSTYNNPPQRNIKQQDVFTIKSSKEESKLKDKIEEVISSGKKIPLSKLSINLGFSEDILFSFILKYFSEIYQNESNPRAYTIKKYNRHFGERIHIYEEFKRIIEYFNGELITTPIEYQEQHKKTPPSRIRFKVNCRGGAHKPFNIRGNHLLAGSWCRKCYGTNRFTYDDCVKIGKNYGFLLITTKEEFEKLRKSERPSHIKLKWRCRVVNHEPFKRSIVRLKTAYCKKCTGEIISRELITRWITSQIFKTKFHTTNIKELISKEIFQGTLNRGNYPLVNMRSYSRMHFDCYAEIKVNGHLYKLAVEFNGPQHYRFNPRFHRSLKHYHSSQQRDKMKIELCKICNITLIILPYKVKNKDFQDYIIKEFVKKTNENLGTIESYDFHVLYRQNDSAQKSLDNF